MLRLVHITDTHVYADPASRFDGVDTRASLARVLAHLRAGPRYDALILGGDLSMDGSRASYRWLQAAFAAERVPVVALPGNHDDPARWPPGGAMGFAPAPTLLAWPPWRVVVLDTRIAGVAHGAVGAAARAWLARTLAGAGADEHSLVFMHHPPLPVDSPWIDAMGLVDADDFWSALSAGHRVAACVCGHVHQTFDRRRAGVRVLTTPSTCVQFAPRSRRYRVDPRPPGYRVLELGDDGTLATEVVRVP